MKTRVSFWGKAVTVAFLVLALGVLFGCDPSTNGDPAEFSGKWTSTEGDQFIIDKVAYTFTYWYGTGEPDYGTDSMDYKGAIVGAVATDLSLLKQESGFITIKITQSGEWGPSVGKFFVIHWKELTASSVREAGAYKNSVPNNNGGMDTVEDAENEYTVPNGYFNGFGTYTPAQ
jgi:hypothetical protein